MQEKVCHTNCEYRRVETSAGSAVGRVGPHVSLAAAIGQWQRRLNACVKAPGGYFEYIFC